MEDSFSSKAEGEIWADTQLARPNLSVVPAQERQQGVNTAPVDITIVDDPSLGPSNTIHRDSSLLPNANSSYSSAPYTPTFGPRTRTDPETGSPAEELASSSSIPARTPSLATGIPRLRIAPGLVARKSSAGHLTTEEAAASASGRDNEEGGGQGVTTSPGSTAATASSRIPTRPRSRSYLAARVPRTIQSLTSPCPKDLPSPVSRTHQPKSIQNQAGQRRKRPRAKSQTQPRTRPRPSDHSIIPLPTGAMRIASAGTMAVAAAGRGRVSPDLSGLDRGTREAFIKNELPPFKLPPGEAVQVYQEEGKDFRGTAGVPYDREASRTVVGRQASSPSERSMARSASGQQMERRDSSGSGSGSAAVRAGTKGEGRPSTGVSGQRTDGASGSTRGLPTSTTRLGLGMGHPSTSRGGANANGHTKLRSGSARSPGGHHASSFSAPRSASLNMLSNSPSMSVGTPSGPSSRLGVAAHFIPPESSYTPPKGADWDEVVLPTVAKKLGIADGDRSPAGIPGEDLAVEWDRDGMPIRWVKRDATKGQMIGGNYATTADTPTRPHAFSPTFEPSPDNPLHPEPPPSLRYQRSSDGIELAPLRTTSGQPTTLGQAIEASPTADKGKLNHRESRASLNRTGSVLGRLGRGSPSVSRQASEASMKNRREPSGQSPLPPSNLRQDSRAGARPAAPSAERSTVLPVQTRQDIPRSAVPPSSKAHQADSHGKGCGCVVM